VDAQSSEQVAALELEPADVIVAGEIIEHLDAPGSFLRAMRLLVKPDGMLIVTTPNAYRPLNVVAPLFGFELIHPDHTAWHSPHTLACLMTRNGWHVESIGYYQNPADQGLRERGLRRRLAGHAAGALSSLARWVPAWSDGLVVGARPDDGNNP
jgi:SAM-dependent methyltransferase